MDPARRLSLGATGNASTPYRGGDGWVTCITCITCIRCSPPALLAATPRIDWATLLRRTFDVDVLRCARCNGRLHVLGEITDPSMVRTVLERLGLPASAPAAARARDPTALLAQEDFH